MALRHPEAVGGLILVDTAAATSDMGNAVAVLEERAGGEARDAAIRVFAGDTSDEAMADFSRLVAPHYVHAPEHAGLMNDAVTRGILALEVAGHYFGQLAAQYDLRSDLHRITAPILIVVGESDWLLPPTASRAIAAGIPGAELVEIPEAGHLPFGERPVEFQEAVRRFLDGAIAVRP
jgi:proline iminopeptidase